MAARPDPLSEGPQAKLTIKRTSGDYRDLFRSYKVLVDGEPVGKLRPGAQLHVEVPAGRHDVQARIDWSGSEVLVIEVAESSSPVVELSAGSAFSAVVEMFSTTG